MKAGKQQDWLYYLLAIFILILLIIFAYGLNIHRYGFLEDDWLTIFVSKEIGKGSLVYHYSFDRPIRGYFALAVSRIYQENMILYQITSLALRLLSAVFILGSLNLIWPKRKIPNLLIACLMVIYPGFLEQPHAYDYLAHFFTFFCMTLSIFLSIWVFTFDKFLWKFVITSAGVVAAFLSYGINDYFIGLEGLRMGLVFIFLYQKRKDQHLWFRKFALIEIVYLVPGLAYSMWRMFFFESKRSTTDSSLMFSPFEDDFFRSVISLIADIGKNAYKVIVEAWFVPVRSALMSMAVGEILAGILMGLAISILMIFLFRTFRRLIESPADEDAYAKWIIVLGLFSVVCSLVPIVFGLRFVDFTSYNRFSFPGSIGASMVIVGLLSLLPLDIIRYGVFFVLITFSLTMQFGNGLIYRDNYFVTNQLWHQLSWRAPAIQKATVISGQIAAYSANEPYTFWSPANLIYFADHHKVMITAEILNEETLELIKQGISFSTNERGIPFTKEYSQLLLFDKPTLDSCLQVIDGRYPEVSVYSSELLREAAPYSIIAGIDPYSNKPIELDPGLFHSVEPEGWCYFYQKSQLARQINDWTTIYENGLAVLDQNLNTTDAVEWMPYVQAFAYFDDIESFNQVSGYIWKDAFLREQACQVFTSYSLSPTTAAYQNGNELLLQTFCE